MQYDSRQQIVLRNLAKLGLSQMLVTDPISIFYLSGALIWPGERFLGLLISTQQTPSLILNKLFITPAIQKLGLKLLSYEDGDNAVSLLKDLCDPGQALGVDKFMASQFLLLMMKGQIAKTYETASLAVDEARAVKDAYEQECMRHASQVNDQAMTELVKRLREGMSELELAEELRSIYLSLGADRVYNPVIAFGCNAANPHHRPGDKKLQAGDTVLLDMGCVVNSYSCDMTRTFFYKSKPTEDQARIYEIVKQANESAEALCQPGVSFAELDATARDHISVAGFGDYFTHRLGHFIGLNDHDYGDVSSHNFSLVQEGNTFTIEPGIYHPDICGVRIEDVVLITKDGHEILNQYPKDLTILG